MMCEKCGVNNATTHIRSIINGKIYETYLCDNCAAKHNNDDNLLQMLSGVFGDAQKSNVKSDIIRCECCGNSFNDIAQSGKCGCAQCYKTFYEQLLPYFKRVHGSTNHIGKTPSKACFKENKADMVAQLKERLKMLVKEEKYEQAAVMRDKIKALEEGVQ